MHRFTEVNDGAVSVRPWRLASCTSQLKRSQGDPFLCARRLDGAIVPPCRRTGLSGFRDKSPIPAARGSTCPALLIYGLFCEDWKALTTSCWNTPHLRNSRPYWKKGRYPKTWRGTWTKISTSPPTAGSSTSKKAYWSKSIRGVKSYRYGDISAIGAETGFASLGCTLALVTGGVKTLKMKPENPTAIRRCRPTPPISTPDKRTKPHPSRTATTA